MTKTKIQTIPTFNTRYSHSRPNPLVFDEPTQTRQAFKDECDINNILKRYEKTGTLPDLIKQNPQYGDFSTAGTFQESLEIVRHSERQFSALPSAVRERFGNDPAKFLEFATNKQNNEELVKMGLATARTPTPQPTPVDNSVKDDAPKA